MAANTPDPRGVSNRGTDDKATRPKVGNPGTLLGTETRGGVPYARYRAEENTWVSSSLKEQGYDKVFGRDTAYGAYTGIVRAPDGTMLRNPDNIRKGQEYLVPLARPAPAPVGGAPVNTRPPDAAVPVNTRPADAGAPANTRAAEVTVPVNRRPADVPSVPEQDRRGTRNRYDAGNQASRTPDPLAALAGPLLLPEAPLAAWLAPIAAWAIAGYELYKLYREWESLQKARADSKDLQQWVRRGVHRLWQNGLITDEEYFLYLSTGVLVTQPESPTRPSSAGGSPANQAAAEHEQKVDELWWRIMWLGVAYNKARLFDYPFNEVYVEGEKGVRYRVDAFNPGVVIISRKFTQFAAVSEANGIQSIREFVKKYKPGTRISDVPSSQGVLKVTSVLTGKMYLAVPVQRHPIPQSVLKEAKRLGVTIIDDFGNEFILDEPQKTYQAPPSPDPPPASAPAPDPPQGTGNPPEYIELTE